jgi:hypothetical protein
MAYDPIRKQTILFGGSDFNNDYYADTWAWNGSSWTQLHPATSPPGRNSAMMAYDPAHGQVVLFGGVGAPNATYLGDTWTWDGSNWSLKCTSCGPTARLWGSMAYDGTRLVLFGGCADNGAGYCTDIGDTWLWSGSLWTDWSGSPSPSARERFAMTTTTGGAVLLFGGAHLSDTWRWTASGGWQSFSTLPNHPSARDQFAMATDPSAGTVLFSGSIDSGSQADTWTWNDSTDAWTELVPVSSPSSRSDAVMAYDANNGVLVLFGGLTGTLSNETWLFNAASNAASALNYHGGPVETTTTNYVIFWEPPASSVSSTYNSLIDRFFGDIGSSSLYGLVTQYYQVAGGQQQFVLQQSTFSASTQSFVDQSPYPNTVLSDSDMQNEVNYAMSINGWTAGVGKEFFVFLAKGEKVCTADGQCSLKDFCAYHSDFHSSGATVLYGVEPYLDPSATGCTNAALNSSMSPNNDPDADNAMTAASHELFETITDPLISDSNIAWCDSTYQAAKPGGIFGIGSSPAACGTANVGGEIGDKCNQMFSTRSANQSDITINGHPYILQEEYSDRSGGCSMS